MTPLTKGFRFALAALALAASFALHAPPAAAQEFTGRAQTVTSATFRDMGRFDVYEVDATSNAVALTLLAPSRARRVLVVKTDSSANAVTITTAGSSATINGASSFVLASQYEAVELVANGKIGASGFWRASGLSDERRLRVAEVSISAADIVATGSGKLGHAQGYPLVAAPGAGKAVEFVSAVVILDFATAAFTGGGNVTVNYAGGGAAVSGAVSAANSVGGSADKIAVVLATAPTNNALAANTGLNLVAASAFTQPGTAAGVVRVKVAYRVHTTGL